MEDQSSKTTRAPGLALGPGEREAVLRQWLERTVASYPAHTSRFLIGEKDPFVNPVGRALREGLPVLLEELTGAFDRERLTGVLDEIVHIRAVQDFTPAEAVRFLFLLKPILRHAVGRDRPEWEALERRIDELALVAFDLYMKCREATYDIRLREAQRRVWVRDQAASTRRRPS